VIAQAAATLNQMFADRFWLAVGSGEAPDESITGQSWPFQGRAERTLGGSSEYHPRVVAG
jgi:coenzyme F420-dependent glucose-6-phosphate dehydrogenase